VFNKGKSLGAFNTVTRKVKDVSDQERLDKIEDMLKIGIYPYLEDSAIYKKIEDGLAVIKYAPMEIAEHKHKRHVMMTERMRAQIIHMYGLKANPRRLTGGKKFTLVCRLCHYDYDIDIAEQCPSLGLLESSSKLRRNFECLYCVGRAIMVTVVETECSYYVGEKWTKDHVKELGAEFAVAKWYDLRCCMCKGNIRQQLPIPRVDDYKKGFSYVCKNVRCKDCNDSEPFVPVEKTSWIKPYSDFVQYHLVQRIRPRNSQYVMRYCVKLSGLDGLRFDLYQLVKSVIHRVRDIKSYLGLGIFHFDEWFCKKYGFRDARLLVTIPDIVHFYVDIEGTSSIHIDLGEHPLVYFLTKYDCGEYCNFLGKKLLLFDVGEINYVELLDN